MNEDMPKTEHLDIENRNPTIEGKFNLHVGKPYRAQVETTVYDGFMTSLDILYDKDGFKVLALTLEDGLMFHPGDSERKDLCKKVRLGPGEIKRLGCFGKILDEVGFNRALEKARKKAYIRGMFNRPNSY